MKKENRHKDDAASDFLKYSGNEMTGEERNAFEKKLQGNPFSEEAAEGLSGIDPEEALIDLKDLKKRIRRKASVKRRIGLYYVSIAASIALLMILSSVWIFKGKNEATADKLAFDLDQPSVTQPEITQPGNIIAQATEQKKSEDAPLKEKAGPVLRDENPKTDGMIVARTTDAETETKSTPVTEVVQKQAEVVSQITEPAESKYARAAESVTAAAPSVIGGVKKDAMPSASGKATNDTSDRVVSMDYDQTNRNRKLTLGTSPAIPAGGMEAFETYARDSIRIPSSLQGGEKKVVTAEITITSTGEIGEIRIIRSPGKEYSDEAARLIREGPAWEPARIGGEKIASIVRLKIVFKSP